MKISKKCQYALRAVFELAARGGEVPVKAREIARSQRISARFLEVILNELKHAGFVESIRGSEGGYVLTRDAKELTVGEVLEYVAGPVAITANKTIDMTAGESFGSVAFTQLWREVTDAVSQVFESKTFADLVEFEQSRKYGTMPNYCI